MLLPLLFIVSLWLLPPAGHGQASPTSGPVFTNEPPSKAEFLNTKGTLVECAVSGNPTPTVSWTTIDGSPVKIIPGVRDVTPSGGLQFYSFRPESFRPDIHATVYRCVASNTVGTIRSRNVKVHGVVLQAHEILVYDSYTIEGNTAVFKCHIPTVLADYVSVSAWIKNDNLLIQPAVGQVMMDKFALMPSGELHIYNATVGESGSRYKCKTANRLSGDVQISSAEGQLFVTERRGTLAPKIIESPTTVTATSGHIAVLACVSQGDPLPSVKWFRKTSSGQKSPITFDDRISKTRSGMIIQDSSSGDSGLYSCEASSELGKELLDIHLTVLEPLSVKWEPSVVMAHVNERAVFECVTSGSHVSISWLHNGQIVTDANGTNLAVEKVKMADRGMYQCFVKNDAGTEVQATAELILAEIPPQFVETFEEITVKPGNEVVLRCVSSGIPAPNIVWRLDTVEVNNSSRVTIASSTNNEKVTSTLSITGTEVVDGGLYSCVASSASGELAHSARINVFGPLGGRGTTHVFAISGHTLTLNCPVYGHPIMAIRWEKGQRPVRNNMRVKVLENGTLIANDADKKDNAGKYNCYAKNDQGQETAATVDVTIMVAPRIVPFEFQDDLLREGMRARLQCVVSDGDVPINISWLKDGEPIPSTLPVSVRVLDEFSSILTVNSITPSHNGKYTCLATNRAASVSHTAQLSVNVPPKVVPFSFRDEQLVEGQLARVSCIVSRGDLPLHLLWEKDGVAIQSESLAVQIKSFDEHSSILSIPRVAPQHNGVYTCVASNAAGTARHSAQLNVNVPPQWIEEPEDISVLKGKTAMLHCRVRGFPQPKITWIKGSVLDENYKTINSEGNVHLFTNGSLSITNVARDDEGFYYCQASNGIGRGLSREVQIKIFAPPVLKQMLEDSTVLIGKEVSLTCEVQGDSPLTVTWFRDGKLIQEGHGRLQIVTENKTMSEVKSTLAIRKVAREDSATYECVAENGFGQNRSSAKLSVIEPPNAPQDLKSAVVGSRTVELVWKAGFDGNSAIKKYIIEYKMESDTWDKAVVVETVNGEPTSGIISQLQPATGYIFRLYAENAHGRSPSSQILRVTTDDDVPAGSPSSVQVEAINVETFKVTWKAPEKSLWNGKIQGYHIGYKEVDTEDAYLFKTLMTAEPSAEDLSVQIGGLKQFTKYSIMVQAYNGKGNGPPSEPVVVMTSEGAPVLPPSDVRCTTLTSQSVHVTWTAPPPESINGILRGYKVIYKPSSDWYEDTVESSTIVATTSATLMDMNKFENYTIEVAAATKAGDGPRSTSVHCRTLDDTPDAPADLKVFASSQNSAIVSWKVPENPNGVLRFYKVYWREIATQKVNNFSLSAGGIPDSSSATVSSSLFSHEVTRLSKGHRYEFWVTAATLAGEGKTSKVVTLEPIGQEIAAKILSFEEKITAPFKSSAALKCSTVGIPEPQRRWYLRDNEILSNDKYSVSSDGTLTIRDLMEENAGDYSCRVWNDGGEDRITYTLLVLSPPLPVTVEVVSVTSTAIRVQWTAPSSKLSKIKGFTVSAKLKDGEEKEIHLGPDVRNYEMTGLNCGTRYEVSVLAHNRVGTSLPSDPLFATTNGSVPKSPTKEDLIEESSSSVSLYLNTWKGDGCPIHHFSVEYASKASNEWTFLSSSIKPEQRRLAIPGLKSGTWYSLRMTAHNSAGSTVAKYDFATLTASGATVAPELQADAPYEPVEGLVAQLNFYLVVPIACTIVILAAIMGVACMCVKLKQSDQRRLEANQRLSSAVYELRRGDSSESFNYLQRGTMKRPSHGMHYDRTQDITPYATLQLTGRGSVGTLDRRCIAPPLPPPRLGDFTGDEPHIIDHPFFPPHTGFIPTDLGGHMVETTFIFPNQTGDTANETSSGYQNETMDSQIKFP